MSKTAGRYKKYYFTCFVTGMEFSFQFWGKSIRRRLRCLN